MALRAPNEGEVALLKAMLNHTSMGDPTLHLYHSSISIDEDTAFADANSVQCDEPGYSSVVLTGSSWDISTGAGDVTTGSYAQQTFSFTSHSASITVYGYYVTNNADDTLLWIEEFPTGPYTLPATGGNIAVTPKIIGQSPIS